MNRKIAACFLAGILSITAVPVPAAAQEAVSGKKCVRRTAGRNSSTGNCNGKTGRT